MAYLIRAMEKKIIGTMRVKGWIEKLHCSNSFVVIYYRQ